MKDPKRACGTDLVLAEDFSTGLLIAADFLSNIAPSFRKRIRLFIVNSFTPLRLFTKRSCFTVFRKVVNPTT